MIDAEVHAACTLSDGNVHDDKNNNASGNGMLKRTTLFYLDSDLLDSRYLFNSALALARSLAPRHRAARPRSSLPVFST